MLTAGAPDLSPRRLLCCCRQRALITVLFELLGREPPDQTKSAETLVSEYLDGGVPAESTKLYEGFVAEEARLFLPHLGDTRSVVHGFREIGVGRGGVITKKCFIFF